MIIKIAFRKPNGVILYNPTIDWLLKMDNKENLAKKLS